MATVAFLTSAENRDLTADDRLAVGPLASRGILVVPEVWTEDPTCEGCELVVIRSPWDWYRAAGRFKAFIEELGRRATVFNRDAHRWLDKRYLVSLGERGVRTLPTSIVQSREELAAALDAVGGGRLVIKPATAAAAHGTRRFGPGDGDAIARAADEILRHDVALLQPYVEAIETDGEWSLVFLGGAFSHAVKKRPRPGDFRVQEELGGTVESARAPFEAIAAAEHAIHAMGAASSPPDRFLYGRVDGIVVPSLGGFCVTEVEVVEPELFLRADPNAPDRFASAIAAELRL